MQINYPNNLSLRKVSLINPVSIEIQLDYLTVQIIPFSKKKKKKKLYSHTREPAHRLRIPDDKSGCLNYLRSFDSATPIILNKNKNRLSFRWLTRAGSPALNILRYNS